MNSPTPAKVAPFQTVRPKPYGGRRPRRAGKVLLLGVPLLLAAVGSWLALPGLRRARADLVTHTVHYDRLRLTVVEHGLIEAAKHSDLVCRVKSRTHGSTLATTFKWVIDEGSPVHQGDVVAELDDSGLQEDLKTQNIAVAKARSDWLLAEENFKIVRSQDQGDLATAAAAAELAEVDLHKYLKGDYVQTRKDVEGRLAQAESDLEQSRDRAAWSERMLRKGFMTSNQVQAERSRQEGFALALDKVREELRVLEQYTKRRTQVELAGNAVETRRAVGRTRSQALAKEAQADSDRLAKRQIYEHERQRARDLEEQIRFCTLRSPRDGIVVYCLSEQARHGRGSQLATIAQGESVREGQVLMQIPDPSRMVVQTQVHEALLQRVHGEPHAGESPGTAPNGQPVYGPNQVLIHTTAFPDRVWHGHVKSLANVPTQGDWRLPDIKLYPTVVAIDEAPAGLKPGMSAEVTILGEQQLEHVLTVPAEAIVGSAKDGRARQVFVVTSEGPHERQVVVGLSTDAMVEVKAGLEEGEEVVLNPETLLHRDGEVHAP